MFSHLCSDDLYGVSWSNPAWSNFLCSANILDYFCDLSNPFYDRQCNNEVIRMQRLHPEQLLSMTGVEFYLYHAQEPILFVIRKQQRLSSTQVTPLAYYYVINGTVLQAPDLSALINSRILTTVVGLKKLLQTLASCARYHPSDGSYSWDDPNMLLGMDPETEKLQSGSSQFSLRTNEHERHKPANLFQIQRTDNLLADWLNRFPVPLVQPSNFTPTSTASTTIGTTSNSVCSTPNATVSTVTHIKEENVQTATNSLKLPSRPPYPPNTTLSGFGSITSTSLPQLNTSDKKQRV